MPVLGVLLALVLAVGLAVALGLALERTARVRQLRPRIEALSHGQRGRLGVWLARDARVPALVRPMAITAFIYRVTPLDLIPDFIPGLGRLDDRAFVAIALWCTSRWAALPLAEHLARAEFLESVDAAWLADESLPEAPAEPSADAPRS